MKNKFWFIFIALLIFICICSIASLVVWFVVIQPKNTVQGSGVSKTETRDVKNFKNLIIDGDFNVKIEESSDESFSITADDNVLPKIITNVQGDDLSISYEKNFIFYINVITKSQPEIVIKYKKLNAIKSNGSDVIQQSNNSKLRTDDLTIELNGSGEIKLDIFSNTLNATLNGSGNLQLAGSVNQQKIQITGSGAYTADSLESKDSEISVNGSGESKLRADNDLTININGSGIVDYYGNPKKFTQNINGSGTVNKL